jgi:integrase
MDRDSVQALLIQYTTDMRNKLRLSPGTMKLRLAAVKTFFEINDFEGINWRKVKRYIGEFYRVAEDRPYTREEIKILHDAAPSLRDKAIILLLASSGMRKGAIIKLKLKHLRKLDKYNIFVIDVYKQAKEHYYTFCTPECRRTIEDYLQWRIRLGEKLTPESPLFRGEFDTRFGARTRIIPMTEGALRDMLKRLRTHTGVVDNQSLTESIRRGTYRSKIAIVHGFRKFFDTTCTSRGMDTLFVEIVMGHDLGLKRSYYKPQMNEVLEGNDRMRGYISVINDLTINEENRLRKQINQMKVEANSITALSERLTSLEDVLKNMLETSTDKSMLAKHLVQAGVFNPKK